MYSVVGIQTVNYTNKAGEPVSGKKLHLVGEVKDTEKFIGQEVETVYISDKSDINVSGIYIGDTIDISYNKYGSVVAIDKIE